MLTSRPFLPAGRRGDRCSPAALTTSLRASTPRTRIAVSAAGAPQTGAGRRATTSARARAARSRATARSAPVPGARILQTEYSTWVAQDRHARATEVLGNTVSQRMATHPGDRQSAAGAEVPGVPRARRARRRARPQLRDRRRELRGLPRPGDRLARLPRHARTRRTTSRSSAACTTRRTSSSAPTSA